MPSPSTSAFLALLLCWLPSQWVAAAPSEATLETHASYRYLLASRSPILLDDEGHRAAQHLLGEHRLRIREELVAGDAWRGALEVDAMTGLLHGDTRDPGPHLGSQPAAELESPGSFRVREAYLQYAGLLGLVRAGLMTSQWGLGLMANNGAQAAPFGPARHGDQVLRVLWAFQPLQYISSGRLASELSVALAADAVIRDENASFEEGDLATQGILSLLWRRHRRALGAYLVHRRQRDADGSTLSVSVGDVFARHRRSFTTATGLRGAVELSFEGIVVVGETTRVATHNAPDGTLIFATGWAARADLQLPSTAFRLELGHASGDDNPEDAVSHRFAFDPDHRVGLVLFNEVLARRSARSVERISDPGRSNRPTKGIDQLVTDGRVGGVTYLYPTLRSQLLPWLQVRGGLVLAWTSGLPADPFTSFQAGGEPRTSLNQPAQSRFLGTEIDAGLQIARSLDGRFDIKAGVEAGVFVPDSPGDLRVSRVLASLGLGF